MFKSKILQVMGIFSLLVLFISCDCGCNPEENGIHKYKPGNIVHHKMTGDPLLVIDTLRANECKLYYEVTDKRMNDHIANEQELR